jgi:hypothetical protein
VAAGTVRVDGGACSGEEKQVVLAAKGGTEAALAGRTGGGACKEEKEEQVCRALVRGRWFGELRALPVT